jgi:hypothetical protein
VPFFLIKIAIITRPVILATQEAKIRRFMVLGQPGQIIPKTPS